MYSKIFNKSFESKHGQYKSFQKVSENLRNVVELETILIR